MPPGVAATTRPLAIGQLSDATGKGRAATEPPEREGHQVSRRGLVFILLMATALLSTGCAQYGAAPTADQPGPLEFGSDTNGPPGITYCSPLLKAGSKVGFADVLTNPTMERAEIKAVELVDPVNLHFDGGRSWDVRKDGALYFWTYKQEGSKYFKEPLKAMRSAGGYIVEPGGEAGVAVPAVIAEPGKDVAVGRILIRYGMGGKEYAEVSNTKYEMKPGGCGA